MIPGHLAQAVFRCCPFPASPLPRQRLRLRAVAPQKAGVQRANRRAILGRAIFESWEASASMPPGEKTEAGDARLLRYGADEQIRTAYLFITNEVLYRLSYISILRSANPL